MDKLIRQIPNAFTLGNLFIGCLAIAYLFYDHLYITVYQSGGSVQNIDAAMPRMAIASYLVFAAAMLDFVDGFLARVLRAQSAIGEQLDSLADMVTFGVVPGLILYQLLGQAYFRGTQAFGAPMLLFTLGFMVTLAAAWRLARFNTDHGSGSGFSGLPTPSMAMLVASLPLILLTDSGLPGQWLANHWVLSGIVVVLSALMVSNLPLLGLKVKRFSLREYPWQLGGMLSGWALLLLGIFAFGWGWTTIPVCFLWYILLSLGHQAFQTTYPTTP
jgi:CDP-diacylglycerol--serine O-phosphatidyltransferase